MKRTLPLVIPIILVGIISCNQAPPAADTTKGDKNKAIVDQYIQATIGGDPATMGTFLADNYKGYGPSVKDSTTKAQSIASWTARWDSVYSSIKYIRYEAQALTISDGQNKGEWVLEWGLVNVDYKNGVPSANFSFHAAYRLENEKVVFSVSYYNVADILEQQGYTFVPPGKKDDPGK